MSAAQMATQLESLRVEFSEVEVAAEGLPLHLGLLPCFLPALAVPRYALAYQHQQLVVVLEIWASEAKELAVG